MTPEEERAFGDALLLVRDAYLGPQATPRDCIAYAVFKLANEARWMQAALAALAEQERAASTTH